jgi:hypothetical protein
MFPVDTHQASDEKLRTFSPISPATLRTKTLGPFKKSGRPKQLDNIAAIKS